MTEETSPAKPLKITIRPTDRQWSDKENKDGIPITTASRREATDDRSADVGRVSLIVNEEIEEGIIIEAESTGDHKDIAEYKIISSNGEAIMAGKELAIKQTRSDGDGQAEDSEKWQWERADTSDEDGEWIVIKGATREIYRTKKETEEGKYLRIKTRYEDDNGIAYEVKSEPVLIPYINDGDAEYQIEGEKKIGETLTGGRKNNGNDPDGNNDESRIYQWQIQSTNEDGEAEWLDIEGAETSNYKILESDEGKSLRMSVEYTDAEGFNTHLKVNAGKVELRDDGQANYIINTFPIVGRTIAAINEDEDPDGESEGEKTYQWQRLVESEDNQIWGEIEGADSMIYEVNGEDEGLQLRLVIEYIDDQGFETSLIISAGVVPFHDNGQASYSIEGDAVIDSKLEIVEILSDPDGNSNQSRSIQWQRLLVSGWEDIENETSEEYKTTTEDEGRYVRAKIEYIDAEGFENEISANARNVAYRDDGQAKYEIEGEMVIGEKLSVKRIQDDPDGNNDETRSIKWQRLQEKIWKEIETETEIYTVRQDDEGKQLRLNISYEDKEGFDNDLIIDAGRIGFRDDGVAKYVIAGLPVSGQILEAKLIQTDPDGYDRSEVRLMWEQLIDDKWKGISDNVTKFTPSVEQHGEQIRVKAMYIDGEGFTTVVSSPAVTVDEPSQRVEFEDKDINYKPGELVELPIKWEANTGEMDLRDISLTIHFNSDIFTPTGKITVAPGLPTPITEVETDEANDDQENQTDSVIRISWPDAREPLTRQGESEIIKIEFNTSEKEYDAISGERISNTIKLMAKPIEGYKINNGDEIFMTAQSFNLDVDGNGEITALGDGLMILRKLFGSAFVGDKLTHDAQQGKYRTTEEIHEFIQSGIDTLALDVDQDGNVTALGDGIMILRRLFGKAFTGSALTDMAISEKSQLLGSKNSGELVSYETMTRVEKISVAETVAANIDGLIPILIE